MNKTRVIIYLLVITLMTSLFFTSYASAKVVNTKSSIAVDLTVLPEKKVENGSQIALVYSINNTGETDLFVTAWSSLYGDIASFTMLPDDHMLIIAFQRIYVTTTERVIVTAVDEFSNTLLAKDQIKVLVTYK